MSLITSLLSNPSNGWEKIREANLDVRQCYGRYVVPMALIAPVAAFVGTTQVGWQIGQGDPVKLTIASALKISFATFFAMLIVIYVLAKTIHWMARTYDSKQAFTACFSLSAFTATPLYLVGAAMVYPMPWFVYFLGLPALGYCVALLYTGVPVMMEINKEKGFLFASAILAIGLVALVGLIVVTVSLWGFGMGPSFVTSLQEAGIWSALRFS